MDLIVLFIIVVAMGLFVAFIAPIFSDYINMSDDIENNEKEEES